MLRVTTDPNIPWTPCWGILYTFATPSGSHVYGVVQQPTMTTRAQPPREPLCLSDVETLRRCVETETKHAKDTLVPIMLRVVWCDVPPGD